MSPTSEMQSRVQLVARDLVIQPRDFTNFKGTNNQNAGTGSDMKVLPEGVDGPETKLREGT